jgi:stage IV sporulation protein B
VSIEVRRKVIGIFVALFIIAGTFNPHAKSFFSIPANQRVSVGDQIKINLNFPSRLLNQLSLYVEPDAKNVLFLDGFVPQATAPGKANIQIRLFGILPVKNVKVEVLPQTTLVPGGQSVGVLLHSEGVIVVGQSIVQDNEGHKHNPAREAGIKIGDVILKMSGDLVASDEQVARVIDRSGKEGSEILILIKRKNRTFTVTLKPVLCRETQRYRVGLYIRDSAAGVGTLSFYNPRTGKFAALGHIITDSDTNQPIDVSDGRVVRASINGIQAGQRGQPGEKIGMFINDQSFCGTIEKNTKFGIYGSLNNSPANSIFKKPIPIALADQIKRGPAEILTVLDGEKIERFRVEITRILPQAVPDSKGLIIEIKDPKLINRTGGIIQGMSGSPIIQEGKIVGAVTHVFINDPTKGYGCLIEWMLIESGGTKLNKKIGASESNKLSDFFRQKAVA